MQTHTKLYMKYFKYGLQDFMPCELLGVRANDVHHIDCKGMGGDPNGEKDVIENLMAIARKPHNILGDIEKWIEPLYEAHYIFMSTETPFVVDNSNHEIFDIFKNTEYWKIIKQFRGSSKYNNNIFY